jgi:hypothetical protein
MVAGVTPRPLVWITTQSNAPHRTGLHRPTSNTREHFTTCAQISHGNDQAAAKDS